MRNGDFDSDTQRQRDSCLCKFYCKRGKYREPAPTEHTDKQQDFVSQQTICARLKRLPPSITCSPAAACCSPSAYIWAVIIRESEQKKMLLSL